MAIETAGREYHTLSDDIFVNDRKVYMVEANDQIVYPDDSGARYALAFGTMSSSYMIDWFYWGLDGEEPSPRESDVVQSYGMSFAFAVTIMSNGKQLCARYCTGSDSLVGRARNFWDSLTSNAEEVLKYQHYNYLVGVPNDIYGDFFPGGYLLYHKKGLDGGYGVGANYLFFEEEKHLVRHTDPVTVHPKAYKLGPEFTSFIGEPLGWGWSNGMTLLGWNPKLTNYAVSHYQRQGYVTNPYEEYPYSNNYYEDNNVCCIGVMLMDVGEIGSIDIVDPYLNPNWDYCVGYAPITKIIYLGDDPEMASVDRVELFENEFGEYSYRLLY